jgi:hypothetical protein
MIIKCNIEIKDGEEVTHYQDVSRKGGCSAKMEMAPSIRLSLFRMLTDPVKVTIKACSNLCPSESSSAARDHAVDI